MENKHTLGNWTARYSQLLQMYWVGCPDIHICKLGDDVKQNEQEANAYLISAAPDLLDIVNRCLFVLGNEANYPKGTNGYLIAEDAKLAIDKATNATK